MSVRLYLAGLEGGTALTWEHFWIEPRRPARCLLCSSRLDELPTDPGGCPLRLLCAHGHEWLGHDIPPST